MRALESGDAPGIGALVAAGRLTRLMRNYEASAGFCEAALTTARLLGSSTRSPLQCLYRAALLAEDIGKARGHAAWLARAEGADEALLRSIREAEPELALAQFENWRLGRLQASDPIDAAYSCIVLRRYDEAFYLLQTAAERRLPALPGALRDRTFIGLFHQEAYEKLADEIGVALY